MLITGTPNSSIGKIANTLVKIPTMLKRVKVDDYEARQLRGGELISVTPMGTIFELSSMIFCEAIIAELMKKREISEREMKKKHTSLE